jgi:hypothetical protein
VVDIADEAENLINSYFPLQLCADLANVLRHVSATRNPRLPGPVAFSTGVPTPEFSSNPDDYVGTLPTINAASGELVANAPKGMDLCVEKWDAFLRQHGLLV